MVNCVFDNRFIAELPADPLRTAGPRQVQASAFSPVAATPVRAPRTVHFNAGLAGRLGLSPEAIGEERFAQVFSGNELLDGMQPWAANYGGHQFGHWAGQLGDGRALSLGELELPDGERWELQLKGAGPTPYSRGADGRAVMRSSLREYVCSEAMHHLGIPTTRALSLVATGEDVVRDMFYDGNPAPEPGAVVCRLAPGFIRFGSFELPAQRGERELLHALLAFTVDRDFPGHCIDDEDGRVAWFAEVCERTATLMAHWMRVGFVHGVMNTDNMSILGQTIDYGPYGWVDEFDPDFTPNTTDAQHRRYRYAAQPEIGWWNLSRLAGALSPLFDGREGLEAGLEAYVARFQAEQARMFGAKLGLAEVREGDHALAQRLFALMQRGGLDMTLMFRLLGQLDARRPQVAGLGEAFYDDARAAAVADDLQDWLDALARRWAGQGIDDASRRAGMDAVNPRYVFRNYLAQQAIDALAAGDRAPLDQLVEVLAAPYDEQPAHAALAARRPQWARDRAGCSMLSCSS